MLRRRCTSVCRGGGRSLLSLCAVLCLVLTLALWLRCDTDRQPSSPLALAASPTRITRSAPPYIHTHTHPFNGPLSGNTQVSRYQKGKTNLDFTEARDSEWQLHQLSCMQVCTLLQTDNHASTSPLCFLQAGCPSCHTTNSVKALKAAPCTS